LANSFFFKRVVHRGDFDGSFFIEQE